MSEVRPIDANTLTTELNKCKILNPVSDCYDGGIETAICRVRESPTLDYEPVVHAHWIDADYGKWKKCSHCFRKNQYYSKYCPWCGAKMDEEVKE